MEQCHAIPWQQQVVRALWRSHPAAQSGVQAAQGVHVYVGEFRSQCQIQWRIQLHTLNLPCCIAVHIHTIASRVFDDLGYRQQVGHIVAGLAGQA